MQTLQLGIKKTFGFWALIIMEGGETEIVKISKKKWDKLKDTFDLSTEG